MALWTNIEWSDVTHMHPLTPTIVFSAPDIWTEMVIKSTITLAWCLPSLLMNANLCSLHTIHHSVLVHNPSSQWHMNTHGVKYLTLILSKDSKYVFRTCLLSIKLFFLPSIYCHAVVNTTSPFSFELISFYNVHLIKSTYMVWNCTDT